MWAVFRLARLGSGPADLPFRYREPHLEPLPRHHHRRRRLNLHRSSVYPIPFQKHISRRLEPCDISQNRKNLSCIPTACSATVPFVAPSVYPSNRFICVPPHLKGSVPIATLLVAGVHLVVGLLRVEPECVESNNCPCLPLPRHGKDLEHVS